MSAGIGGRAAAVPSVEVDPAEVGFDAERLQRIDRHFARYVDDGRLTGWLTVVTRHGRVAHVASGGQRDQEAGLPVEPDTLWRIYSMTKPIVSVAAMMLWEEGAFELKDPVARFIPAFADARVFTGGTSLKPLTEPLTEPVRVWHLLTHTSGLTYGFHYAHPVDAIYREHGFEWSTPPGLDLAACCDVWAGLPLLFQPGREWNYSVATDVLGRVVEVVSGQPLDAFLAERILGPLGMEDTTFWVREPDAGRPRPRGPPGRAARRPPATRSGARRRRSVRSGGRSAAGAPGRSPPRPDRPPRSGLPPPVLRCPRSSGHHRSGPSRRAAPWLAR